MTAVLLFVAAIVGGAIAALSGFGIGSVLTPLLALSVGTKQAVVAVSIPHLVATSIRFWNLRHKIDRHLLKNFGIASAGGGCLERGWVRASAVPCWLTFLAGFWCLPASWDSPDFQRRCASARK